MDKIKNNLYKNNISKQLMDQIDSHLKKLDYPGILITSSHMTEAIFSEGIEKLYRNKINFIHTLGSPFPYIKKEQLQKVIDLSNNKDTLVLVQQNIFNLFNLPEFKDQNKENIQLIMNEIVSLDIAKIKTAKEVIYFSSGYETSTPDLAGLVLTAKKEKVNNLKIIPENKLLLPAVRHILNVMHNIDGYIAPGDLTILTGTNSLEFIIKEHKMPVAIGGFISSEILTAIEKVLDRLVKKEAIIDNCYSSLVNQIGNPLAQEKTFEIFSPKTTGWYGYGLIPFSGLTFNQDYAEFFYDTGEIKQGADSKPSGCICPEVLMFKQTPDKCPLFINGCNKDAPQNTCMALYEGLCSIYLEYSQQTGLLIDKYKKIIE